MDTPLRSLSATGTGFIYIYYCIALQFLGLSDPARVRAPLATTTKSQPPSISVHNDQNDSHDYSPSYIQLRRVRIDCEYFIDFGYIYYIRSYLQEGSLHFWDRDMGEVASMVGISHTGAGRDCEARTKKRERGFLFLWGLLLQRTTAIA